MPPVASTVASVKTPTPNYVPGLTGRLGGDRPEEKIIGFDPGKIETHRPGGQLTPTMGGGAYGQGVQIPNYVPGLYGRLPTTGGYPGLIGFDPGEVGTYSPGGQFTPTTGGGVYGQGVLIGGAGMGGGDTGLIGFDPGEIGTRNLLVDDEIVTDKPPVTAAPDATVAPQGVPPAIFNLETAKQEINQIFSGITAANAALMASLSTQLLGGLDRLEADIKRRYQEKGSVIDPATQAALGEIRAEIARRRQGLTEEMNRRGLLQSGIWLEMENRILNQQLTAEERLLAGRVADLQNRLSDALFRIGERRIDTMGQLGQMQAQQLQWTQGQQLGAMRDLNTRSDQMNRWWQEMLAQQRRDVEDRHRWEAEQAESIRRWNIGLAAQQAHDAEDRRRWEAKWGRQVALDAEDLRRWEIERAESARRWGIGQARDAARDAENIRQWEAEQVRQRVLDEAKLKSAAITQQEKITIASRAQARSELAADIQAMIKEGRSFAEAEADIVLILPALLRRGLTYNEVSELLFGIWTLMRKSGKPAQQGGQDRRSGGTSQPNTRAPFGILRKHRDH
ncbi:MAG: hypothetical protein DDT19_01355 [Syntrophomonadaceae bacterium]|nr:hypothetical protein [Bacillota bacterium]